MPLPHYENEANIVCLTNPYKTLAESRRDLVLCYTESSW